MRTLLCGMLLFGCFLGLAPAADEPKDRPPEDKKLAGLAVGKDLPGTFHPFNITGKFKGRYHCPVTQQGLDPLILVFTNDLDVSDPLKELLRALDNAVEKNPNERLAVAVVFLDNLEKGVAFEDDKRDDLVAKIDEATKGLMLKHVVLTLDDKKDVAAYGLDSMVNTTVVMHRKYEVKAVDAFPKLDADSTTTVLKDVADKLGAMRK